MRKVTIYKNLLRKPLEPLWSVREANGREVRGVVEVGPLTKPEWEHAFRHMEAVQVDLSFEGGRKETVLATYVTPESVEAA
jgi:hypothetical protein